MTASDIADKILDIEARVSDLDWRRDGVNLWPLYRCLLFLRLFEHTLSTPSGRAGVGKLSSLWGGALPDAGSLTGCTVLLNDGFSLQRMGDRVIDRFCTPLAMGLDRIGVPNVLLDQGLSPTPDLAERVGVIGPMVLRTKVRNLLRARLTSDRWIETRRMRLCDAAVAIGLAREVVPSARDFSARQGAVFDLASRFESILRHLKADRVLQVSYYSVAGYAMNLAARRLGLPSIDVQHGAITPLHLAYARWSLPEGQDHLLPTGNLTWGPAEARVVLAGRDPGDCIAVAGGHPLVAAWRAGWLPGVEDARAEARRQRELHPSKRHVLVSLQPGLMGRSELEPLLAALAKQGDIFCWFRLHPVNRSLAPELASIIENKGLDHDIEAATRLPLFAVLENVDVNLTHSSTTVVEAANFGVPSILWSEYGWESFTDMVEAGLAYPAIGRHAIRQMLTTLPERSRDNGAPADQFTNALETLTR